jgi:hypothetical protein
LPEVAASVMAVATSRSLTCLSLDILRSTAKASSALQDVAQQQSRRVDELLGDPLHRLREQVALVRVQIQQGSQFREAGSRSG